MADNPAKKPSDETEPLLAQASTSAPNADNRPRTVRHHRRALSGRSTRSGLSGQISFGPSFNPNIYPDNDPSTRLAKQAADGRARSRFLKALLVGIGLWLVIGAVFGWAGLHRAGWGQGSNRADYGAKPSVPRSDGRPIRCAKFDTPISSSEKSRISGDTLRSNAVIEIPLNDLDSFFIHALGSFAKGRISIDSTTTTSTSSDSNLIVVQVSALTNDEALVDLMNVCHVSNSNHDLVSNSGPQNVGLGIYTPTPEVGPYPDSDLEFNIHITIPSQLTNLNKFQIHTNLFGLSLSNFKDLKINEVDMITSLSPIQIDELVGERITIRTNNGHIEGSFRISKALNLATVNGAINARVALASPNQVFDSTSSGSLLLNNESKSLNQSVIEDSVTADIATINGAVTVDYIEHPLNLNLYSFVKSTNGRADVKHATEYEGVFEVETTWGSADIKGPFNQIDPSNQNRDRQKLIQSNRDELGFRHISGLVWWGIDNSKNREVKSKRSRTLIKTTLGSARATFK